MNQGPRSVRRRALPVAWVAALLVSVPAAGGGQEAAPPSCSGTETSVPVAVLGRGAADVARLAEVVGIAAASARAWTTAERERSRPACAEGPLSAWTLPVRGEGVGIAPVTVRATVNSGWPSGRNDGLQWAGRGVSGLVSAGVEGRSGRFSFALRPQIAWAENRDFVVYDTLSGDRKPFAYPWHARRIDWPQRFGDEAVTWVHPGESYLRAELGPVRAGISSEIVQWGPARRYPLLLSAQAPGFAHVSVEFGRPVALGSFATLEAQLLWGVLEESDHFDLDADNDRRLLSGLVVSLQPLALPGLHVGAASLVQSSLAGGLRARDLLNFAQVPAEDAGGNVDGNGLGSVFVRWIFPESGFEAYAEWARDDYSFSVDDLIAEPDHSQAYTLGFQHAAPWGSSVLRLAGELTHLSDSDPDIDADRPTYSVFYTHALLPQGHTHRGQLLGGAVGPGSDGQHLSLDVIGAGALTGVYLERVRWDDDAYVRYLADAFGHEGHDVELTFGVRHDRRWRDVLLELDAAALLRRNRSFTSLRTTPPDLAWKKALRVQIELSWWPGT